MTMGGDDREPEILFKATVKADELRFDIVPENRVVFTGDYGDGTKSGSVRTNLPDEVEKDVTYRDVRIDYAIVAELAAAEEEARRTEE